ncbi:MDR family MFS transporter [Conexibacter sp. SYSU D00693]|uniref:MDR family MFS transporter n=1 Tax=Conexibacter sp. SYSU D00693 TaxID=2812560 RepID=UPI00196AC844|nr:MDR family MFS transporter [Conexibacter sp. SYSU D00693]
MTPDSATDAQARDARITPAGSPAPTRARDHVLDSGMTHRQVLEALSGLLLAMFVAILSSTVVTTALPEIIGDLGGTQSSYTWVVTSTLLALTVSTPVWGKLADLHDRKLLVQTALTIYVAGSILAGLSQSTSWLIGCRVVQGLGVGGLTALVQVILSDLVSPRERGRYSGYLGAVFGLGTVAGPLLGGLVTDAFGWRWCFYVGVPFAAAAFVVLQRTLHLPRRRREAHIDVPGALLIASGVSSLLIWVSLAGQEYDWLSWQTALLVGLGVVLCATAVAVERRVREPLVPLRLFGDRTVVLAVVASIAVGIAMFGTTVFLSQYMQIARGKSPIESGLLTIPMVVGLFVASTIVGRLVTRTGRYKRFMLAGTLSLTVGLALMGTIDERTSLVEVGAFMLLVGAGVGMTMQNLVLVVQNTVRQQDIGAGSSLIAFFRSLGGAIGVSVLGALLAHHARDAIADGLAAQGVDPARLGASGAGHIPDVSALPEPVARVVEHGYGTGIAEMFLVAAPLGLIAFLALLLLREQPLGTKSGRELAAAGGAAA